MNDNCPCKDCFEKRKLGCHGFCEEYQAWKKDHEEALERRRKEISKGNCHSKAYERNYNKSLRRR